MAESNIPITGGSGYYQGTFNRTVGGVSREDIYALLGEPGVPTYTALATGIATTTSASHLIQLMADGTNYTRLRYINVQQVALAGAVTLMQLQVFRLTTAGTGGSAITARPFDTGDTNGYAGGVMTLPSSKGTEGNQLLQRRMVLATAQQTFDQVGWTWQADLNMKPIVIQPAATNGICIKIVTGIATSTVDITLGFTVTSYS